MTAAGAVWTSPTERRSNPPITMVGDRATSALPTAVEGRPDAQPDGHVAARADDRDRGRLRPAAAAGVTTAQRDLL
jgi:hypothetical protein